MAKSQPVNQFDVLAIGDHSSAWLAAAAIKSADAKLVVGQTTVPGESPADRLTLCNPKLFSLHVLLSKLTKVFSDSTARGARFLSEKTGVAGVYESKTTTALVIQTKAFTTAVAKAAVGAGVIARPASNKFAIEKVVDDGVQLCIDGQTVFARTLIVATSLPADSAKTLGLQNGIERDSVHQYRYATLPHTKDWAIEPNGPVHMSLDLAGTGAWAWLIATGESVQLAVAQPARRPVLPAGREMQIWVENLIAHKVLSGSKLPKIEDIATVNQPFAGALGGETVANRTLLVGPAGGFFTACAEELYPSCWSAVIAAETIVHALKQRHVQDALLDYREKWGSTLGDYLRGPQQNLKLLLPLVYRNPIMASRVGEAIFLGESVVR